MLGKAIQYSLVLYSPLLVLFTVQTDIRHIFLLLSFTMLTWYPMNAVSVWLGSETSVYILYLTVNQHMLFVTVATYADIVQFILTASP